MPQKYEKPKFIKVLTAIKTYDEHPQFPKSPKTPVYKKRLNYNYSDEVTYRPTKLFKNTNKKNINVPAESSIKRWIGNSKFKTGFNPNIFRQLKMKADMKKNVIVSLCLMK